MLTREFVLSFREAAPYINAFRGKTFVIAINGETIQHGHFTHIAQDINLLTTLGVRIVLAHGIRPQMERLLAEHHLTGQFHCGRQITDLPALDIVKQAIGLTRHEIEATLSMGLPNSPMHGSYLRITGGNMLTARPLGILDGQDMQYTGQLRRIDTQTIVTRLEAGQLVLLSPIGYSPTGETFHLTMEEIATYTAIRLKAEKLIFLVNSCGVLSVEHTRLSTLTIQQAEELLNQHNLDPDVATYLPYAITATRDGVARGHLVSSKEDGALLAELFTSDGAGTMVARDLLVRIRTATIDDIGDILGLIHPLEEQGVLVKRHRELLEMNIADYSVLEHDKRIYGCVAMHTFADTPTAELACLAISPERRNAGFGKMLFEHVESQARNQGLSSLFVLTTQAAHWFIERGFVETDTSQLPLSRQGMYNYQRCSKIFIKTIAP